MGKIERSTSTEESISELSESSNSQLEEIITEDGILCYILSSLTLIEAVRTSLLSTRWRSIWTHLTEFKFDAINVLDAHTLRGRPLCGIKAYKETKGKTDKFILSVNSILQHLQVARLDKFEVRYFLDKTHSCHLDEWVRFAVASKTKTLRLHLFEPCSNSMVEPYDFPLQMLGSSPCIEAFSLIFCSLRLPYKFDGLGHLKELALSHVDITEEDFNCIMFNCSSSLTHLGVWEAPWESLNISHPLAKLEVVLVQHCDQLRKIEINAVNLRKLIYDEVPADFRLRQSSKLKNAYISFRTGVSDLNLGFYLNKLATALPHLQSLTLQINGLSKVSYLPKDSSRFVLLTRLDWLVSEMSLQHLTTLLDAAPLLQELKLCMAPHVEKPPPQTPSKTIEKMPKHSRLKNIEIRGFYFEMWQIEIVVYLFKNASGLESMTLVKGPVSEEIHEMGLKNLSQQVPSNVKLLIL